MFGLNDVLRCIFFIILQDIESDDEDLDDEVDDGAEDEHEHEAEETPAEPPMKTVAPPAPPKDTERQLSKKELKKKELAELDAVLAELGLSGNSSNAAQDGKNCKCDSTLCCPLFVLWCLNHVCMMSGLRRT